MKYLYQKPFIRVILWLGFIIILCKADNTVEASSSGFYFGDEITWQMEDDGTLYINGKGALHDWDFQDILDYSDLKGPLVRDRVGFIAFRDLEPKLIIVGEGITHIGDWTFAFDDNVREIKLPSTLISIGSSAFSDCEKITQLKIPSKVRKIDEEAFADCYKLKKIILPKGVEILERNCFCNCMSLKEISIPYGVKTIENECFNNCANLKKIVLPSSVSIIKYQAFADCNRLEEIIIPKTLKEIGENAFYTYYPIKRVYYSGSKKQWKKIKIRTGNENLLKAKFYYNYKSRTPNPITVSTKKVVIKASGIKKKSVMLMRSDVFTVKNEKGVVRFKKKSGSKNISISKAGVITVKKGTKKGTYKIKVIVTSAGNDAYAAGSKTVTVKIKVK